jgi:CcmD family protein
MILPDPPVLASALTTVAQEASRVTGFAAETAAARPEVVARGFRFLIGAYTAVWVILAAYLLSLSVRLRRLSAQVRRLKERAGL